MVCVDHRHYKDVVGRRFDPASCSFVELMMKFSNHTSLRSCLLIYLSDYLLELKWTYLFAGLMVWWLGHV